ncbi:hypothetical protein ACIP2X_31200 [Streptomyces sp. NPDC089424]|uniref:hypothetical protein n=1 Tax=Streptomyces sp. NPDC089424 TaxID=3365917 RepID=UPI0037F1E185
MKRDRWAVAAGVLVLGVLGALPGCGVEDRTVRDEEPGGPARASECAGRVPGRDLHESLASVSSRAQRHPDVFTGLSVDEGARTADVYRVPSAAFDADVCSAAGKGVTLRLYDTDVNRRDLDALAARVSADMNRWDGTFELREVGVDERGWVHVGVDDPRAARDVLVAEFGGEHLRVVEVGEASAD